LKGVYEVFCGFGRRENKANSKPIKANLQNTSTGRMVEPKMKDTKQWVLLYNRR